MVESRPATVRDRYRSTLGSVPMGIERRLEVASATDQLGAVEAIEELRRVLLKEKPLGARVQQLVHFGQLLALGRADPARLYARGALCAGASLSGVVP